MIAAIDLEGVLAPEIWPHLGDHFHVEELHLTTRDVGDFEELMRRRVEALNRAGLTLARLQEVAHEVRPYLGSHEFLDRIRRSCQVMIISDTFQEFAEPIIERLGGYNLFANQFEVDAAGHISGWKLRIRGQKARVVQGMKSAGFKVIGMGDSLNDLTLLESADYPILFRPVDALRERLPSAPVAHGLDEALKIFEGIFRSNGSRP
ncbi:MAG TPA: bifunctional phosphoserine phosphatase/homoserine phosphotransferase ThrH [Candidatus Polarisedimenticolia bacterium]|nr:bifunctional phosphoserine phosphatase/homoserine phosphotransferase ThrH [Candidatus Polarisedimenticolia bacterium]